jgi:hypothetical protein
MDYFNDTENSWGYTPSNGGMISEQLIVNHMETRSRGLIWVTTSTFVWRDR